MKKRILYIIGCLMILPCMFLLSACDFFGFSGDIQLQNGTYEVVTYSINGTSQTDFVGSLTTINNNTLTDWSNNVATYSVKGNKITLTWQTANSNEMVLTGTVTQDSISIDCIVNNIRYIIVLNKVN